ncbi:hypothetical protein Bbelb_049360 [Branchiostoma belcheri]|nr:hypothetical protein Bbelb_049360 [Branchiostoma belcheri]
MRKRATKRARKSSAEQTSPHTQLEVQEKCPPPTPLKMAGGADLNLDSIAPELRPLVQLLATQSKSLHEEVMAEFKSVRVELSEQIRAVNSKLENLGADVNGLRESVSYQSKEIEELQQALQREKRERIRATLVAERYSMKTDIIIRGLAYHKEESPDQVVLSFLSRHLGISVVPPLVAVHRLSRPTESQPNPAMLVRLVSLQHRELILATWKKLHADKKKGYAVHEHLPRPLQQARAKLMAARDTEIDKAKSQNKEARVFIRVPPKDTSAILVVNGKTLKTVDAVDLVFS